MWLTSLPVKFKNEILMKLIEDGVVLEKSKNYKMVVDLTNKTLPVDT